MNTFRYHGRAWRSVYAGFVSVTPTRAGRSPVKPAASLSYRSHAHTRREVTRRGARARLMRRSRPHAQGGH